MYSRIFVYIDEQPECHLLEHQLPKCGPKYGIMWSEAGPTNQFNNQSA